MKNISKFLLFVGIILMLVGLVFFMYNKDGLLKIYLIIIGLILMGLYIFTNIFDNDRIRKTPKNYNFMSNIDEDKEVEDEKRRDN